MDLLRNLSSTRLVSSSAYLVLICDRIGRGGPDPELIELASSQQRLGVRSGNYEIALVAAWLRLHEIGYEFPAKGSCPDLLGVLHSVDLEHIGTECPDLIKRARAAARELGVHGNED